MNTPLAEALNTRRGYTEVGKFVIAVCLGTVREHGYSESLMGSRK